jgi:hypothetical protein
VGGVAAQFFTNTGAVLTGGKLFTYAAGTTTPATTFTSSQGTIAWTNPIVLDAAGRVPSGGEIWLTDGTLYKFLLKDSSDVLIATYDNISGINSNFISFTNSQEIFTATANQTVFNLAVDYQPGTNSLSVFVDGVNQYGPGAQYAYTETDSNTVTFVSGLHVGASVKFTTTQQQGAGAVDASQVSYTPPYTGSDTTNVEAKLAQIVNILDFIDTGEHAAIINGTSTYDISNGVRYAIDSLGPNGGVVYFPDGGKAVIGSTVYIPPHGYGVTLEGNRFTVAGGGYGTHSIFETGMPGNSVGGSSSWTAPNESVLNEGLCIYNFNFIECGTAIKAFNAIWRSEFTGNWGYTNCSTLIHAKRCFYSKTLNNTAVLGKAGRLATDPNYWFEEVVNVQTIEGNSASGVYGGSSKSGIGYLFTGGMAGLQFANNSAEGCIKGISVTSEIAGATIAGCYFELNTVGIDLGSAGKALGIYGCFFFSNVITAIYSGGGWTRGVLESDNSIDPVCLVDLAATTNLLTVNLPGTNVTIASSAASYSILPPNWSVGAGATVNRPFSIYDPAVGYGAQRALMSSQTNAYGLVPFNFVGDIGQATNSSPFATVTVATPTVTVDTLITYRVNTISQFYAIIDDGATGYKISGSTRFGNTVFRQDATAITVVASNQGGNLRLVFGGFTTPVVIDIRVWVG